MSLARVSAGAPVCSPSCAAAAAEGARPITVPPASVQARVRACRAVVFPAPAGAMASCSRDPEVAIARTSVDLPGVELHAVGGRLEQRQLDRGRVDGPAVRAAGGARRVAARRRGCGVEV